MKVKLAIAVAALQVGLLAFMGGQREWISRTGERMTLRTAPIDPNDPMRGAYVRFNFEISFVPARLCKGAIVGWLKLTDYRAIRELSDRVVYASLRTDDSGLAELVSLSDTPPATGPVLRGRVVSVSEAGVDVRYGIEAMFMHKEAALALERDARESHAGAPMDVIVATSPSGIGVAKSYEWEPLGITLEFDPRPRDEPRPQPIPGAPPPGIEGLTVVLHNHGGSDIAIVDFPDDHSFRLVPNTRWSATNYSWVGEGRTDKRAAPTAGNIIVLKPGEVHKRRIDLMNRNWWIIDRSTADQTPFPIRDVKNPWSASFRIEYAPPPAEALAGLPNAGLVGHRAVRSRAFSATRYVD